MTAVLTLQKPEDGTAAISRSMVNQFAGWALELTRAEFDALYGNTTPNPLERVRIITNGTGVMPNGSRCRILGEVGVREWLVGTGGSDAANAAASHARTVIMPNGARILLDTDANTMTATTGQPTGSSTSGHRRWDQATGLLYTYTSAWTSGDALPGSGGSIGNIVTKGLSGIVVDAFNRPTAWNVDGITKVASYGVQGVSQIAGSDGSVETYTYDTPGNLTGVVNSNGAIGVPSAITSNGTGQTTGWTLLGIAYVVTYKTTGPAVGQVDTVVGGGHTTTFLYDGGGIFVGATTL